MFGASEGDVDGLMIAKNGQDIGIYLPVHPYLKAFRVEASPTMTDMWIYGDEEGWIVTCPSSCVLLV